MSTKRFINRWIVTPIAFIIFLPFLILLLPFYLFYKALPKDIGFTWGGDVISKEEIEEREKLKRENMERHSF